MDAVDASSEAGLVIDGLWGLEIWVTGKADLDKVQKKEKEKTCTMLPL